jgi:UDP-N-acetylmuramate dehydrogenase
MQAQLSGLEFAIGIPGTLGGAIKMNAGAFNHSISEVLNQVRTVGKRGIIKILQRDELLSKYRTSCVAEDEVVVEVEMELKKEAPEFIKDTADFYREWRKTHQPAKVRSAGCIFKNPTGLHAGKLIDELGLKGLRHGDAMVSDVHANFIINRGSATARDILTLMEKIQKRIFEERGVELIREVEVVGED